MSRPDLPTSSGDAPAAERVELPALQLGVAVQDFGTLGQPARPGYRVMVWCETTGHADADAAYIEAEVIRAGYAAALAPDLAVAGVAVPESLRALYDLTVAPAPWPHGSMPIANFEDAAVGWVRELFEAAAPTPRAALEDQPLWAVHVRGPDDIVAVASYDDAVRVSDGLNLLYASLTLTEDDPWMSAVPCLWVGRAEDHAADVARLGTRGYDYGVPTDAAIKALRDKVMASRVAAPPAPARGAVDLAGVEAAPEGVGLLVDTVIERIVADVIKPGVPEVRECSDVAEELRRYRPSLVRLLDAVRAFHRPAGGILNLIDALKQANFDEGQVYGREGDISEAKFAAEDRVKITRATLDAAIAALQRDAAIARTSGTGSGVLAELRRLSERATPGPWSLDEMSGFVIGGCEPGQGPDDEVPEDWEPPEDEGDDPYPTAKLSAQLDGRSGEHDLDLMVQAVNDLRARISAEDRDRGAQAEEAR